jgi:hypothetical protein
MTPDRPQKLRMDLPPPRVVFKRKPSFTLQLPQSHPGTRTLRRAIQFPAFQQLQNFFQIQLSHAQTSKPGLDRPGRFRMRHENSPDLGDVILEELLLTGLFGRLTLLSRGDLKNTARAFADDRAVSLCCPCMTGPTQLMNWNQSAGLPLWPQRTVSARPPNPSSSYLPPTSSYQKDPSYQHSDHRVPGTIYIVLPILTCA